MPGTGLRFDHPIALLLIRPSKSQVSLKLISLSVMVTLYGPPVNASCPQGLGADDWKPYWPFSVMQLCSRTLLALALFRHRGR